LGSAPAYLDYNATAPVRPEAAAAVAAALHEPANPSSVHAFGRRARRALEQARATVAASVGALPDGVVFVSGGTEANNLALLGSEGPVLVSAIEHPSVLEASPAAVPIPVDRHGRLDLDALERLIAVHRPRLVSVMLANNETGVIQPIAEVAALAHQAGALVHSDAIQAVGRIPVEICALGVDVLTLSAHKIGGPQGAGAVVRANEGLAFAPFLNGGGQERRSRAGTENVAAIAGFGVAAKLALADIENAHSWSVLRDAAAALIRKGGRPVTIFGEGVARLPQTLCVGIAGMSAETLVIALDLAGIAVSSGSACSSGKVAPSHVLAAMGVDPALAHSAIRISFGWESAKSDLDLFASAWRGVLKHIAPGEIQAA
jgi:cysteine desulfurase